MMYKKSLQFLDSFAVALCAGAWVETSVDIKKAGLYKSLSARERGLKYARICRVKLGESRSPRKRAACNWP